MSTQAPAVVAAVRLIVNDQPDEAFDIIAWLSDDDRCWFAFQAAANLAALVALTCEAEGQDVDETLQGMGLIAAEADL